MTSNEIVGVYTDGGNQRKGINGQNSIPPREGFECTLNHMSRTGTIIHGGLQGK